MEKDLFIGHDVGTGGTKSVIADAGGRLVASTFSPYKVSYPGPNRAEQDPVDWWRAVCSGTVRMVGDSGVDPVRIGGVGFAGQMLGIVPVDAAGSVLRPAIIWLDGRAKCQAERLVSRLGGKRVFAIVAGALPTGKDAVCKLAWLRENEPGLFERTTDFLDVTGYLVFRATGNRVIDDTGAAGTGILDGRKRKWSPVLARATGVRLGKMPRVVRSTDVAGGLTAGAAGEMGLSEGTPVIAGMADIPAAATGSGALENGDAHINLGTSSWLCLSLGRRRNLPRCGMVSVASPDPSMYILIGESETAGMCLKWFAENLALPEERRRAGEQAEGDMDIFGVLDEVAAGVEPGARGLIFAPWMYGERSPVPDTTLRGSFANLSVDHTREDMLRSIYEGVAFNLRWMLDEVRGLGFGCPRIRAIGGGARSDFWMQVTADVTGRVVEAVENPQQAGAVGCALAVGVALGVFGDYKEIKRAVRVRKEFVPDTSPRNRYDMLYQGFKELYPGLSRLGAGLNR